jgi:trans-4-hydroxy-L-proline dehydratase
MLPERIAESIDQWFEKDYRATFFERVQYLVESEPLFADLPIASHYARTLEYILARISVFIRPGEKIVGSVAEVVPTPEQAQLVNDLSRQWWDIPLEEIQKKALFFYSYGWLRRRPPWFMSMGHLALDWEGIVTRGLADYEQHAEGVLKRPDVAADPDKVNFLEGAITCYRALSAYITRYAEQAAADAERTRDPFEKVELRELSDSLAHLSHGPARTFREALQLMWLIILPLMKVAGCGVFNLHRIDQYLLPFYQRDLQKGLLTREKALELIEEFYNKNNEIMTPTDHMSWDVESTTYTLEVTFDDPNYLTLGGLLPGGKPGVNDLSCLFLEAQHAMGLRNPFVVVRYYPGMDETFWQMTCDAVRDNATVVIYNDATMIPALKSYGVAEEDVYEYGFYGCNDPNLPANEGGLRQLWFNMVKPLELALHEGEFPMTPGRGSSKNGSQYSLEDRMIGLMTGPYYGVETPPASEMTSIDDVLDAYRQQVRFLLEDYRQAIERDLAIEREAFRGGLRIEDCFLHGTIDNAHSWNHGGTKYHKITLQGSGMASVADSLAGIEQLVFRDREMTMAELAELLRTDFAGQERLRTRLQRRMPKYGNDVGWVDELAAKVVDIFCDEAARVNRPEYLYKLFPCISTDRDFTTMGLHVGATPDGRCAGQQIAENQSPTEGADMNGLTALLNSAARLPFDRITGGPLNLRIHPSVVKGEEGLQAFAATLKTYFQKGGMQVQVNVASKEQLLAAQKEPNKYRSLCVRVTGYSAYFVQMGKKAQDELIRRTEQK